MIDREKAPNYNDISEFKLLEPVKETLNNGIDLFVFNSGEQDLVRIEWVFDNLSVAGANPLYNVALSAMLLEGTKKLSGAEIAEKIDFYGAFLQPEYSFDHTSLTLYVLNRYVGELLPMLKDILTNSIIPSKELDTYIRNNKQSLAVSLNKTDFIARRTFNKSIFGDTKYGFSPTLSDYDNLERELLLTLLKQQISSDNCTIFIAGKVESKTIDTISAFFGGTWGAAEPNIRVKDAYIFNTFSSDITLVEKTTALQSAIRIGNLAINRTDPDFSVFQLVNTILGGYFGSRLMNNIREDKGYTYGIGSGIGALKHGAFFTIATEVGVEVTAATLEEIEKEINRLKSEKVPLEELNLVKNYIAGTFLGSLENVFSHVDKFKNIYFNGLDMNFYTRHLAIIKNSDTEDILMTANKYLHYDRMAKIVVGKIS
ncbi:insulinase family protein [Olivibacter sp. SDN3]|uniref:M16 family metallopeptidase n=1 Tax=Olivibacter sp. SDN3 TaxID=2764720 RepID=UPI001650DD91|nr:pitrilysin family protein [Olivibacter sp. SDN3]QNL48903.1 insulinase family protein [Olivibacter sp. SDN3]